MTSTLLDNYIKDMNAEYNKLIKQPHTLVSMHFMNECLKEIGRAEGLQNALKHIKDYGKVKVGNYLEAQIDVNEFCAKIWLEFKDNVLHEVENPYDYDYEYLSMKVKRMILALIDWEGATFELRDTQHLGDFHQVAKLLFEPTEAEENAIDKIVEAVLEESEIE